MLLEGEEGRERNIDEMLKGFYILFYGSVSMIVLMALETDEKKSWIKRIITAVVDNCVFKIGTRD